MGGGGGCVWGDRRKWVDIFSRRGGGEGGKKIRDRKRCDVDRWRGDERREEMEKG